MKDMILVVLATLRLTRFVTQDWLGEWWLVGPAKRWAIRRHNASVAEDQRYVEWEDAMQDHHEFWSKEIKLVKGLDCPFCIGFWVGAGVLLVVSLSRRHPSGVGARAGASARFALAALALNYVTGNINQRMDS